MRSNSDTYKFSSWEPGFSYGSQKKRSVRTTPTLAPTAYQSGKCYMVVSTGKDCRPKQGGKKGHFPTLKIIIPNFFLFFPAHCAIPLLVRWVKLPHKFFLENFEESQFFLWRLLRHFCRLLGTSWHHNNLHTKTQRSVALFLKDVLDYWVVRVIPIQLVLAL